MLLFLPKILSVLLAAARAARRFGGTSRLVISMAGELVLSVLLAPIRMLFHTRYVLSAFIGWNPQWKSPRREDTQTTWREAMLRHGPQTLLGMLWAGAVYALNPSFLWWLLPVAGALIVSIPVSVYTSRVSLGRRLRALGIFVIPEELDPPMEILATTAMRGAARQPGVVEAVVDPLTNALICAVATARKSSSEAIRKERGRLVADALVRGPDSLSPAQKMRLIGDRLALSQLHAAVWTSPEAHPRWREPSGAPPAPRDATTHAAERVPACAQ
jgi:membrane glycosyltransferase